MRNALSRYLRLLGDVVLLIFFMPFLWPTIDHLTRTLGIYDSMGLSAVFFLVVNCLIIASGAVLLINLTAHRRLVLEALMAAGIVTSRVLGAIF